MAKWSGIIGYAKTVETSPGVWEEKITKRNYRGDVIRNSRVLQTASQVNDNVNVNNVISIVADPYANENLRAMRYIEFMGAKWKITDIEVERPRLKLTIGGLYNG